MSKWDVSRMGGFKRLPSSLHCHQSRLPSTGHTIAALTVAVFDVFLDSVGIGMGLFFISYLTMSHNNLSHDERQTLLDLGFLSISSSAPSKSGIILIVLYLVYLTTGLVFAILLIFGICEKSTTFCYRWMNLALVNLFVKGIQFVYFSALNKETLIGVGSFFVEPVIRLAMFYVIYSYTKKLKRAQWQTHVYLVSSADQENHRDGC